MTEIRMNKSVLGYPPLKRGWFYAARELDGQLGVLTEDADYGTLQKSYSIWICNEHIPVEDQNSMTNLLLEQEPRHIRWLLLEQRLIPLNRLLMQMPLKIPRH